MSKLDNYLRSIERFGAAGAILVSGQAVTLKFPTGDRQATQVTPHDQLVALVREIAPPAAVDQVDRGHPAKFEHDSNGTRYALAVVPRSGAWQVTIDVVSAGASAAPAPAPATPPARQSQPAMAVAAEMMIERGQYDGPAVAVRVTASGSVMLDDLTRAARAARATDLYLGANATPMQRVAGELAATGGNVIEGELLARELGLVAPAEARGAWSELGSAVFSYSDGAGRLRVTLGRDHRGPSASLRLLPDEPPTLAQLTLGAQVESWLGQAGLITVAGASGAGKTLTLAALVRALGDRKRRVVTLEDPIELIHTSASVSQRAIGTHVPSIAAGVTAAMSEGVDAIVIGSVRSPDAASALLEALAGGHLVLTTIAAPGTQHALDRIEHLVSADRRDHARALLGETLLGTIRPIVGRGGVRTFEVTPRRS